jgi:curved DNA-binding protein CbpA
MATEPDPYRTLGLAPTATVPEVKAAYRRLAKANHPDAAGEAALPRFLAIQAAYERLVGPTPGRVKGAGGAPAAPRQPWQADQDRTNATHRAYGGRARRPASAGRSGTASGTGAGKGTNAGPPPGSSRPAAGGASADGASDTAGAAGGSAGGPAGAGRSSRPKKATLGSTSYDEVERETFEPDWGGASWYGTTSGTYWTINPKEYADPRKHGPEYQARARRAARAGPDGVVDPVASEAAVPGAAGTDPDPADPAPPTDTPRHTTSSWWDSTSGPGAATREEAPEPARSAPRPRPSQPPRPTASTSIEEPPSLSRIGHALTVGAPPSFGWRVARATIGWLPIGLAIGWASGELTGCSRFAATCDPGTAPLTWAAQALVFVLLLALPTLAGWAVVAAVVSLIVAVPATLFVTASAGGAAGQAGPSFLGIVLGLAWLGGAIAAAILLRGSTAGRAGPVS